MIRDLNTTILRSIGPANLYRLLPKEASDRIDRVEIMTPLANLQSDYLTVALLILTVLQGSYKVPIFGGTLHTTGHIEISCEIIIRVPP